MTSTTDFSFDREKLMGLIEAIRDDPEKGKTVWKARTRWRGGFRSEADIREHSIPMDEPMELGGSDTAPNMVEAVLGAYGCCLTTGYAAQAAFRGIDLRNVEIEVEGDLDLRSFLGLSDPEEVWPGYSNIRTTVRLDAPDATPEQLEELHDAVVSTSPVGSILKRPIPVTTELIP